MFVFDRVFDDFQVIIDVQFVFASSIQFLINMGTSLFFLASFLIFQAAIAAEEYRIVDTKSGQIRGVRRTSLLKKVDFYAFKGIPFGKSPTGDLRFKVGI